MDSLTKRETEIIQYAAEGLNNNEIAQKMFVSKHTIKAHLAVALKKLSAVNRTNVVYKATKNKLIK